MSAAGTIAAITALPQPDLWAIGSYEAADGAHEVAMSRRDLDRDTAFAAEVLGDHGIGSGDHVLITSGGWEAPWFWPVARAVMRLGGVYCATEIWPFDARRTEMFLRRLPIRAVVGIDLAVAAGVDAILDLAMAFRSVDVVLARPDAIGTFEAAGIEAHAITPLGPALAIEGPERDGLRVDPSEWRVDVDGGRLTLSTVGDRACRVAAEVQTATGAVRRDGDAQRVVVA